MRFDVAAYAQAEGLNLEDAGRRVRYSLAEPEPDLLCRGRGRLHRRADGDSSHLRDRLETFLARLVTGAGSAGLPSIAPVRGRIVRPLIDAGRADVTAYLTRLGQHWREDASNADTTRQRAWVRHELLPMIEGGTRRSVRRCPGPSVYSPRRTASSRRWRQRFRTTSRVATGYSAWTGR